MPAPPAARRQVEVTSWADATGRAAHVFATSAWNGLGANRPKLRLGLSTCFDCPWEGRVPEEAVIRCVGCSRRCVR